MRCTIARPAATAVAARTAHRTAVDPEPASRSPSPVIHSPTGIMTTITAMGRRKLRARCGIPGAASMAVISVDTTGSAPGRSSSPVS